MENMRRRRGVKLLIDLLPWFPYTMSGIVRIMVLTITIILF